MPEILLTVRQLSTRLQLSPWSIYEAVRSGRLPARRLHPRGRLRFVEAEVMEALRPAVHLRELRELALAQLTPEERQAINVA
jgi:excisionase family DNA binding protein